MKTNKELRQKFLNTASRFMYSYPDGNHLPVVLLCEDIDTQESELTKLRKRVEVLEAALKVLRVAVNDKQPDPGAVAFIEKALTESAKIAESKEQGANNG